MPALLCQQAGKQESIHQLLHRERKKFTDSLSPKRALDRFGLKRIGALLLIVTARFDFSETATR